MDAYIISVTSMVWIKTIVSGKSTQGVRKEAFEENERQTKAFL